MNKIEALSNLSTDTILGLTDCSFADRARALPGVSDVSESIGEVEFAGSDEEIDVAYKLDQEFDCEERMVVMENFIVAGGLRYDSDAENPMQDGCANGNLYHQGRRASGNEEACFEEALGMDGYGNRDLNNDVVSDSLSDSAEVMLRKNRSLMATLSNLLRAQGKSGTWEAVFDKISEAVNQEGYENAIGYVANYFFGESYWHNVSEVYRDKFEPLSEMFSESAADEAWERAVESGKLGNPLAVLLDIYEHGGISYSVSGGGMQCRWDTSSGGAVWVPDEDAIDNIRSSVLSELCAGQVKWFGSIGGPEGDTLNARYSLDNGDTWVGEGAKWKWVQAVDAMLVASGVVIEPAKLQQLLRAQAEKYCEGVLESYNDYANGNVYGVCYYVIDRNTGERVEGKDNECWGHVGSEYAEKELEDGILSLVAGLGETIH